VVLVVGLERQTHMAVTAEQVVLVAEVVVQAAEN
jgi:hypothetical protein